MFAFGSWSKAKAEMRLNAHVVSPVIRRRLKNIRGVPRGQLQRVQGSYPQNILRVKRSKEYSKGQAWLTKRDHNASTTKSST
jgi:hypothetical protein